MIDVKLNTFGSFSSTVQGLLDTVSAKGVAKLNKIASREVVTGVKRYHRAYDARGGWRKGGGGGSTFGELITRAWSVEKADASGVVVANAGRHYRQKVDGGVIKPKFKGALTIPLVPEAKGRTVELYEQVTGNTLFKPKGKSVLMAETEQGLMAIYALRKSVNQAPWKGALPPEKHYLTPYIASVERQIEEELSRLK